VKEERQGYEKGNQKLLLFIFSSTTRTKFGIHHFEKKVEKKNRIKRKTKANLEVVMRPEWLRPPERVMRTSNGLYGAPDSEQKHELSDNGK
jgi:hypothetical protein